MEQWLNDLLENVEKETSYLDLKDLETEFEGNNHYEHFFDGDQTIILGLCDDKAMPNKRNSMWGTCFQRMVPYLDEELCSIPKIKSSESPNRDIKSGYEDKSDKIFNYDSLSETSLSEILTGIGELEDGEITDIKLVDNHISMNLSDEESRYLKVYYMDNGVEVNIFERNIMYATALLTKSHVFDDDSPASISDMISKEGPNVYEDISWQELDDKCHVLKDFKVCEKL